MGTLIDVPADWLKLLTSVLLIRCAVLPSACNGEADFRDSLRITMSVLHRVSTDTTENRISQNERMINWRRRSEQASSRSSQSYFSLRGVCKCVYLLNGSKTYAGGHSALHQGVANEEPAARYCERTCFCCPRVPERAACRQHLAIPVVWPNEPTPSHS